MITCVKVARNFVERHFMPSLSKMHFTQKFLFYKRVIKDKYIPYFFDKKCRFLSCVGKKNTIFWYPEL